MVEVDEVVVVDGRNVAGARLPCWGRVVAADGVVPWLVVDPDGVPVEPIRRFLTEFVAAHNRPGSVRSYAYALLRWWRWLRVVGVSWDAATAAETRDMVLWFAVASKPGRPPGSVGVRTAGAARYAWGQVLRNDGRIDEAAQHFHFAATYGVHQALDDLALMLADDGRLSEAHEVLNSYHGYGIEIDYRHRLAHRLAEQGRTDDLHQAIKFGNPYAAQFLAVLRAINEPPAKLGQAAVTGDEHAARALILLQRCGSLTHADKLERFGLTLDGHVALDIDASRTAIPETIETPDKERLLLFEGLL